MTVEASAGGGAVLSDCRRYRYRLWRNFKQVGQRVVFVMLNPSTADAAQDDPTIRRCISFAKRLRAARLDVVNLYGLRATEPSDLFAAADPVGPLNDAAIVGAIREADELILAWGATKAPRRDDRVDKVLWCARDVSLVAPCCFGQTADGSPRHPLYVRRDALLMDYPADAADEP